MRPPQHVTSLIITRARDLHGRGALDTMGLRVVKHALMEQDHYAALVEVLAVETST